jgi:hypothetical protein
LIEFIGATAVIDFINKTENSFKPKHKTEYFDFGIKKEDQTIDTRHFHDVTRDTIMHPLTLLTYAMKIYLEIIPTLKTEAFYKELNLKDALTGNAFHQNLSAFFENHYKAWLKEMSNNERKFQPFNIHHDLNSLVREKQITTSYFSKGINEAFLKDKLGKIENKLRSSISDTEKEKRLLKLLYQTAKECFEKLETLPSIS